MKRKTSNYLATTLSSRQKIHTYIHTPVSYTAHHAVRFIYEVDFNVRGLSVDSALLQCHKNKTGREHLLVKLIAVKLR